MKVVKILFIVALAIFILTFLQLRPKEVEGKQVSAGESFYISFFWIGFSDTDCKVRGSLMMDTLSECEAEYTRAENKIMEEVAIRNSSGVNHKWGVFEKCGLFLDDEDYIEELNELKKKCSGQ